MPVRNIFRSILLVSLIFKTYSIFSTVTFFFLFLGFLNTFFRLFIVCVFVFRKNSSFSKTVLLIYEVSFLLVQSKEENKSTVSDKWICRVLFKTCLRKIIFDWQIYIYMSRHNFLLNQIEKIECVEFFVYAEQNGPNPKQPKKTRT